MRDGGETLRKNVNIPDGIIRYEKEKKEKRDGEKGSLDN